jgi:RimJ/RimL family protein N-acetyltransferase
MAVPTTTNPMRITTPLTLTGSHVRLEPIGEGHAEGLLAAAQDESIWRWMLAVIHTRDDLRAYLETAYRNRDAGTQYPFVTIDQASGRVIGSTRYDAIDPANRGLEIGWTWINPAWQRTAINTEAKYLMLRHAFEVMGCIRVQLKTDSLNEKSRAAIARLGAKEEGTLRNHMIIAATGRIRHSVLFSITAEEWPTVKASLEGKLAAGSA